MGNSQSVKEKTKTKTYNYGDNNINKMSFEQAVKQEANANVDTNQNKKKGWSYTTWIEECSPIEMSMIWHQILTTHTNPWQRWFLSLLATVPLHFFVLSKSGNEPSQHVINMRRRRGRGPPSLDSAPDRQSLPLPSPKGGLGIAGKAYKPPSLSPGNRKTTSLFTFILFIAAAIQSVPPFQGRFHPLNSPFRYSIRSSARSSFVKLSLLRKWQAG